MSAQITMSLEEYKILENAKEKSETEIAALKQQVIEAKLGDEQSLMRTLASITRHALQVARFAMANLPPEVIKGWPASDLKSVGLRLDQLPDFSIDDRDLALELVHFADECDRWEHQRKLKSA